MHDTACLGLVHWDDPEGWNGEGGGRRVQDGEHLATVTPIPEPLDSGTVGKRAGKMLLVSGPPRSTSAFTRTVKPTREAGLWGEVGRMMGKWKTKDAGEQECVGKETR